MPTQSKTQHTLSKGQHTPGPWYHTASSSEGTVYANDGTLIVPYNPITGHSYGAQHANARLIAQAPRMLELLDQITDELYSIVFYSAELHPKADILIGQARQILAEVEGS